MPESVKDGELSIYVERMIRLIQLLRIYEKVLVLSDADDPGELSRVAHGEPLRVAP